ncbi:hypothetical protein P5673_007944 [Acropora cervicornis]|uniref:Uncharacterized protein n=1 Tax=Acropora cervicornis TaxID=6130 RepID=A0AAD9QV43_ACRCE|nr:hypothetical protein P5673_007944 [Acropora cervicornis]
MSGKARAVHLRAYSSVDKLISRKEDISPVFGNKHLIWVHFLTHLQPMSHLGVHAFQICQIEGGFSAYLIRMRKVLSPMKACSWNIKQNIPEIGEELPFVAFIVMPPVGINAYHFLVILKFIHHGLALINWNPDFCEIYFKDGVRVNLIVHGQGFKPFIAEKLYFFKVHEGFQEGSNNATVSFC